MINNGIYIAVHLDSNGNPYVENCGKNISLCTTTDFFKQKIEAERFMKLCGASQIYWFHKYPFQLENPRVNQVEYIQNYGMLICSELKVVA